MKLAFQKYGSGPALIILHGLYGSSDNWMTVAKILAENFEVFVPDMRNHGNSPHNREHTYMALKHDLLDFYSDNKIDKAILCGHSMGGKTSMLFALLHPEKIEKLIIIDIAPKAYKSLLDFETSAIQHLNIMQAFKILQIENFANRSEIDKAFSEYVPDIKIRGFLLKNVKRLDGGGFTWKINVDALNNYLPDILDFKDLKNLSPSDCSFPTLFINGQFSRYVTKDDYEIIKHWFPQAEIKTIDGSGHWVHADKQQEFIKCMEDFIRQTPHSLR